MREGLSSAVNGGLLPLLPEVASPDAFYFGGKNETPVAHQLCNMTDILSLADDLQDDPFSGLA